MITLKVPDEELCTFKTKFKALWFTWFSCGGVVVCKEEFNNLIGETK